MVTAVTMEIEECSSFIFRYILPIQIGVTTGGKIDKKKGETSVHWVTATRPNNLNSASNEWPGYLKGPYFTTR